MSQSNEWQRIIRGIILSISLAISVFTIVLFLASIIQSLVIVPTNNWAYSAITLLSAVSYFIGVTQLLYIIPLIIVFWRQRRFALMKGVIIGAVIVALVNFGCFLFVMNQLSR
ncbi:MAG: hypothetical protein KME10_20985 [Plectolyngbya sp. WJT66-NPBG17]|jgi:hypothetical protein|nr:hypothetical protein [Plectolyngbya sp. WJT66-NPBG17]